MVAVEVVVAAPSLEEGELLGMVVVVVVTILKRTTTTTTSLGGSSFLFVVVGYSPNDERSGNEGYGTKTDKKVHRIASHLPFGSTYGSIDRSIVLRMAECE